MIHDHGACVYLCGASKQMPKAVRKALLDVIVGQGEKVLLQMAGHSSDSTASIEKLANDYLVSMETSGRLQRECWS